MKNRIPASFLLDRASRPELSESHAKCLKAVPVYAGMAQAPLH